MNDENDSRYVVVILMCLALLCVAIFQGLTINNLREQVATIEESVLLPWNEQITLNDLQKQRDDLQDLRILSLEESRDWTIDIVNDILDHIEFIFRVIDDYIL